MEVKKSVWKVYQKEKWNNVEKRNKENFPEQKK